ncbi:MAG: (d)CMP kinase [Alphaproteobacteria bacterium]|nr:(d)CMP kinase [Alphaproteobacteria bacterium]
MTRRIAIAVDGPGSSGKGTVARGVARALGYQYVDTGAMYRAVALLARRRGIGWDDGHAIGRLATELRFRFQWDGDILRVEVDGEDLTRAIRADDVGQGASRISRYPEVRAALLGLQRELGAGGGVVMDGRDIGTVVLPNAELKIFLDASLDERARRRHEELLRRGEMVHLDEVRAALDARDRQDRERATAPLVAAADAIRIDTTELTIPRAIDVVLGLARDRTAG